MRLINCTTLKFEEFIDEDHAPTYAILSHTWGDREVSFKEFKSFNSPGASGDGDGAVKIKGACLKALQRSLDYIWIDTCCIDKRSSAELSEAINSMYKWYKNAKECFVYLDDFACKTIPLDQQEWKVCGSSRWFSRGWTLQELIAPAHVRFYDQKWKFLGKITKPMGHDNGVATAISTITGIHQEAFGFKEIRYFSVAQRMSWASRRTTSRGEDVAYCLLGLFDVNMPLLYGEGRRRAFRRLQEEIIKKDNDLSIFASEKHTQTLYIGGMFADSPIDFKHSGDVWMPRQFYQKAPEFSMTNKGLRIENNLFRTSRDYKFLPLACKNNDRELVIHLRYSDGIYLRTNQTFRYMSDVVANIKKKSKVEKTLYIQAYDHHDDDLYFLD